MCDQTNLAAENERLRKAFQEVYELTLKAQDAVSAPVAGLFRLPLLPGQGGNTAIAWRTLGRIRAVAWRALLYGDEGRPGGCEDAQV